MQMQEKTLVIFDVDDTLLNSMKLDSNAFSQTYEEMYGEPLKTIDWAQYEHVTDTTIFNTAFSLTHNRLPSDNEVELFRSRFVDMIMTNRKEQPSSFSQISGSLDMVNFLLEQDDYLVGIASGGWMAPARSKLHFMGFELDQIHDSYADGKVSREEILIESLTKARKEYPNLRPVYLGDAIWDVRTTRNLQMDFVGVRLSGDHQVLENQGATQVISDYQNVQGFLQIVDQATPPLPVEKIPNF